MFAPALEANAWQLSTWLAARLAAPRRVPVPASDVRAHLAAMVQSPYGAALLSAMGLVLVIHAVRSAWFDIDHRWFTR